MYKRQEWDKVPRVDTLLIDYLGADDNEYVREMCIRDSRTARDLDASEADWLKFVEELRQRKG